MDSKTISGMTEALRAAVATHKFRKGEDAVAAFNLLFTGITDPKFTVALWKKHYEPVLLWLCGQIDDVRLVCGSGRAADAHGVHQLCALTALRGATATLRLRT
jgi:hypothetical protein